MAQERNLFIQLHEPKRRVIRSCLSPAKRRLSAAHSGSAGCSPGIHCGCIRRGQRDETDDRLDRTVPDALAAGSALRTVNPREEILHFGRLLRGDRAYLDAFSARDAPDGAVFPRHGPLVLRMAGNDNPCRSWKNFDDLLGQAAAHFLQPVHFFMSTTGRPSAPMDSAPNGQTRTHVQ